MSEKLFSCTETLVFVFYIAFIKEFVLLRYATEKQGHVTYAPYLISCFDLWLCLFCDLWRVWI